VGAPIKKDSVDQFRVQFGELAKVRRGEPVQVDPFLIARGIALVMRECTVRSAAGRPILWNEYRMILARGDFDLVRSLQGPLERDLATVLAQEAGAREAELVGALRVTVVFDEADELARGQGVVRVAFVPTEKLVQPRAGEMTMRFDGWAVAGEIAARAPQGNADTMFVHDSRPGDQCLMQWPGGQLPLPNGSTVVVGRPHPEAPPQFVGLAGAGAKVNKQHFWIAVTPTAVRVGRLANANPVHVNGRALGAGEELEVALPAEISLSRGDLLVTVRR
jgi:hypothetical protein